jgi:hypothetical protein
MPTPALLGDSCFPRVGLVCGPAVAIEAIVGAVLGLLEPASIEFYLGL